MKRLVTQALRALALSSLLLGQSWSAHAATGDMGTGVPIFGMYTGPLGSYIRVWGLASATVPFPQGCTSLVLSPATMGQQDYKNALAIMLTLITLNKPVRFFAHAERDGGCGVDYLEVRP